MIMLKSSKYINKLNLIELSHYGRGFIGVDNNIWVVYSNYLFHWNSDTLQLKFNYSLGFMTRKFNREGTNIKVELYVSMIFNDEDTENDSKSKFFLYEYNSKSMEAFEIKNYYNDTLTFPDMENIRSLISIERENINDVTDILITIIKSINEEET
ncbi:hypothetical protein RhiirA4_482187 [Rhizophagus irregularis]|uniref:Uncharacterized protein n=1 Tax=Rhizophagus irregularis TaxID=588596 RepID=A0A2I1HKM3_9GLOM|nr:hypothetical protein RhiirA4_482187 [Rhizophagus irregularis]